MILSRVMEECNRLTVGEDTRGRVIQQVVNYPTAGGGP
jgi:hypothetical protein